MYFRHKKISVVHAHMAYLFHGDDAKPISVKKSLWLLLGVSVVTGVFSWSSYFAKRVERHYAQIEEDAAWNNVVKCEWAGRATRDALRPDLAGTPFSLPPNEDAEIYSRYQKACARVRDTYLPH